MISVCDCYTSTLYSSQRQPLIPPLLLEEQMLVQQSPQHCPTLIPRATSLEDFQSYFISIELLLLKEQLTPKYRFSHLIT